MPSCFQLFKKDNLKEAVSLSKIDEEICALLGVPVDPKHYGGPYCDKSSFNWFDTIGFTIATNSDKFLGSQELRDHYLKDDMWKESAPILKKILDYLEANYSSRNFYQSSNRVLA